jgi:hypothetical protein
MPRQLALRDEPAGRTAGEPPPVGGNPPCRYQHHHRRIASPRQSLGNLKTIDAGQLDIEQHNARMKQVYRSERRRPIVGLANDIEPLILQELPGQRPEAGIVVHDHHRWPHQQIVARGEHPGIGATPRPSRRGPARLALTWTTVTLVVVTEGEHGSSPAAMWPRLRTVTDA